MKLRLSGLTKRWGDVYGVRDLNLEVDDGEMVAFLGPSGCGKTTSLLMVAGIYKPTEGEIFFDDQIINELQPRDRRLGMVFQSYALYPHMTVLQNIGYPLKLKKMRKSEIRDRVQEMSDLMGIGDLLDRRPAQLSGGQQQRVALGRAIVKEPSLLLFDEPLSNLDARMRLTMRSEIKRLQTELGITSIYVTHDQVEALTMADKIAVMREGLLEAFDTPDELYDRPPTTFVASFIGNPPMNMLEVEVKPDGDGFVARREGLELRIPRDRAQGAVGPEKVLMGVRPEDVHIEQTGGRPEDEQSSASGISGQVTTVEPMGRETLVEIAVEDNSFRALVEPTVRVSMHEMVRIELDVDRVHFFDLDTTQSLIAS